MARRGCSCCRDGHRPLSTVTTPVLLLIPEKNLSRPGPGGSRSLAGAAPARCGLITAAFEQQLWIIHRQDAGRSGLLPQGSRCLRTVARCRPAGAARPAGTAAAATHCGHRSTYGCWTQFVAGVCVCALAAHSFQIAQRQTELRRRTNGSGHRLLGGLEAGSTPRRRHRGGNQSRTASDGTAAQCAGCFRVSAPAGRPVTASWPEAALVQRGCVGRSSAPAPSWRSAAAMPAATLASHT